MQKIRTEGVQGATFGVMEGTIMMMGVLLGLSVTGEKLVVVLGLLTAGIADAFANTASFYVSEESEMIHSRKEVFKAAKMCFIGTVLTVAAIVAPILAINNLKYASLVSFLVGMVILILIGGFMSKKLKSKNPSRTVVKYVTLGVVTALFCYMLGNLVKYISSVF